MIIMLDFHLFKIFYWRKISLSFFSVVSDDAELNCLMLRIQKKTCKIFHSRTNSMGAEIHPNNRNQKSKTEIM